ncbi:hypothetical protein GCM10027517_11710 [Phycicoccus ginsengisoli]
MTCFGITLPQHLAHRAATVAAMSTDEMQQMHLSAFDGTALDLTGLDITDERTVGIVSRREWMLPFSSRACPACLTDAPVWPLWWRLQCAGCCPTHRLRLLDVCPACGIPFTRGYALEGRARALSDARIPDPTRCGNHTPHGPCKQVLADLPAHEATNQQADFQNLLLSFAHPSSASARAPGPGVRLEGSVLLGGRTLTRAQWFMTLRDLSAITLSLTGTDPRMVQRPSPARTRPLEQFLTHWSSGDSIILPTGYRSGPPTARACLALFDLLAAAMTADSEQAFAAAASPLVQAFVKENTRRGHDSLRCLRVRGLVADLALDLRRKNFGRIVAPVAMTRHRPPPEPQAAPHPGATPVPAPELSTSWALPAAWIPTLVPVQQYNRYIVEHLPGTATTTGRRFAALSVARLAGANTWANAGRALGLGDAGSTHVADVIGRRISDPDQYWRSVAAVLAELGMEPVDYRARIASLAGLRSIPASTWTQLTTARAVFRYTTARSRHAAAWVWAEHTGGPWTESPAALAPWPGAIDRNSRVEGYRRFDRQAPTDLRHALLTWAAAKETDAPTETSPGLSCPR